MLDCSAHRTEHAVATHRCGQSMVIETFDVRPDDTLFLLDWDDTLLASSWLHKLGLKLDAVHIPDEVRLELAELEKWIIRVLSKAVEMGTVCIVTNAETGWVELSARKFVPKVLNYLHKVKIVSARSKFEPFFPKQLEKWKYEAFKELFEDSFTHRGSSKRPCHVISFGDSIYERNALLDLVKQAPNAVYKSVKFVERPSMYQLQKQLDIVFNHMADLCKTPDNVDLMLESDY